MGVWDAHQNCPWERDHSVTRMKVVKNLREFLKGNLRIEESWDPGPETISRHVVS